MNGLCKLGFHKWIDDGSDGYVGRLRHCDKCLQKEQWICGLGFWGWVRLSPSALNSESNKELKE